MLCARVSRASRLACWVTLLNVVAVPAWAIEEPLRHAPIFSVDPDTHVPKMSWEMHAQVVPAYILYAFSVRHGSTVVHYQNGGTGTPVTVDSGDTDWHAASWPITNFYTAWPSSQFHGTGAYLSDGDYVLEMWWAYDVAHPTYVSAGSIPLNCVDGSWSFGDVPPDPGPPPADGTGRINVIVKHAGIPQAAYSVKFLQAGPDDEDVTTTTGPDGRTLLEVKPGVYSVHVSGNFSADGTLIEDSGVRTVVVALGRSVGLSFDFDSHGRDSAGSGGSPGEPGADSGTGGWLMDVLRAAFVPASGHFAQLRTHAEGLLDFGPLALIREFWSSDGHSASGPISIELPVMLPNSAGVWSPTGTAYPLTYTGLTSTPLWPTFRAMMGAGVWLSFVWGVTRFLTPKMFV